MNFWLQYKSLFLHYTDAIRKRGLCRQAPKEGKREGVRKWMWYRKEKTFHSPPSPLYNLSATTDQSTVLAENQGASPPQKRIIFLPPWLSQLLAVFMITILNNNEYLGVFPWNTLPRRNSGCRTYFRPKPEEKVRVKYNLILLTQYSRVPCRFLLFYYLFTDF